MSAASLVLPLATATEAVHYVVIDDEPRYRLPLTADGADLQLVGAYRTVDDFIDVQRRACHVVVLDLCLNRQTGNIAVLQGVRAIHQLREEHGHRILVYTADARPEPVARCVAAGAAGFISKYAEPADVATAIAEVGRHGQVVTDAFKQALRELLRDCRDRRLSSAQEETLVLLGKGLTDTEIARRRQLSVRTIEDQKRKILDELVGIGKKAGFADLTHELGVGPGDLVNDEPGQRPARGVIKEALKRLLGG